MESNAYHKSGFAAFDGDEYVSKEYVAERMAEMKERFRLMEEGIIFKPEPTYVPEDVKAKITDLRFSRPAEGYDVPMVQTWNSVREGDRVFFLVEKEIPVMKDGKLFGMQPVWSDIVCIDSIKRDEKNSMWWKYDRPHKRALVRIERPYERGNSGMWDSSSGQ